MEHVGLTARPPALRRETHQHALVRISNERHVAMHIHDAGDELEHGLELAPIFDSGIALVGAADQPRDQHHVRHRMVIPHGLLLVDAVRKRLLHRTFRQLGARQSLPTGTLAPQRPDRGADEQTGRFAEQMVVRRGVARPVACDEMTVLIDAGQPAAPEPLPGRAVENLRAGQQKPGKRPVNQPYAMLQADAPVHPQWIGTLPDPRVQQRATSL